MRKRWCWEGGAMALLDEKNLAAEAAKRALFRVHHVGTKRNQAELHELEALAAKRNQTQGELIRRLILRELEHDKTGLRPSAEMVEITACRLLLVNLLACDAAAGGQKESAAGKTRRPKERIFSHFFAGEVQSDSHRKVSQIAKAGSP